jgi:mxaJ protein
MSSACNVTLLLLVLAAAVAVRPDAAAAAPVAATPLRVCADPNNLPFSNLEREGFENKIAELLARELRRPLTYFWWPQRRGFVRNTLDAGRCDLIVGVPTQSKRLPLTRSYYRSSYAFVTRRDRHLDVRSFDDPRLKTLTIGIQITGDDYNNPPAAHALAARHIVDNVRGFTVYGDYAKPDVQRDLVDAVADQRIDVAVVWGPLAGFFARRQPTPIDVVPVSPDRDGPALVFAFDIAMAVRPEDGALRAALDAIIGRRGQEIRRILTLFGVPVR